MSKVFLWIAIGIAMGAVVSVFMGSAAWDGRQPAPDLAPAAGTAEAAQIAARQYEALTNRIAELEARMSALSDKLEQVAASSSTVVDYAADRTPRASSAEAQALSDRIRALRSAAPQTPDSDRIVERLVSGGFTRDRAEWIKARNDEHLMKIVEARYVAERSGEPLSAEQLFALEPDRALRKEIGDAEYEQYLRALGREPMVNVASVIENSPAARAGLRAGDRIVSYGGTRVFDFREITPLTLEGQEGEPVVVDVVRNGQPMQIIVPRGPLGVSLSSARSLELGVARP